MKYCCEYSKITDLSYKPTLFLEFHGSKKLVEDQVDQTSTTDLLDVKELLILNQLDKLSICYCMKLLSKVELLILFDQFSFSSAFSI